MNSRSFTTLLAIVAVVGSALLGQQRWRPDRDAVLQSPQQQPGYSARDAEIMETGADGRALYRLEAAAIQERPAQGDVRLERVHMTYRGENSNQWSLTAAEGVVRENNEHVELIGSVQAVGVLAGSNELARISTERLSFDTRDQIATTDGLATLRLGKNEMYGTGLYANFKEPLVRLISDVHGQFTP